MMRESGSDVVLLNQETTELDLTRAPAAGALIEAAICAAKRVGIPRFLLTGGGSQPRLLGRMRLQDSND